MKEKQTHDNLFGSSTFCSVDHLSSGICLTGWRTKTYLSATVPQRTSLYLGESACRRFPLSAQHRAKLSLDIIKQNCWMHFYILPSHFCSLIISVHLLLINSVFLQRNLMWCFYGRIILILSPTSSKMERHFLALEQPVLMWSVCSWW